MRTTLQGVSCNNESAEFAKSFTAIAVLREVTVSSVGFVHSYIPTVVHADFLGQREVCLGRKLSASGISKVLHNLPFEIFPRGLARF